MHILVTGAKGFMGRNLMASLESPSHEQPCTLFPADVDTSPEDLRHAALQSDFVFHLAGVNRPLNTEDFQRGNRDFTIELLSLLKKGKCPPVLISSSTQAALDNPYGISKRSAEDAVRAYGARHRQTVMVYRLTNVFGRWSRPNYNSAVATFCHNIARGLPIQVNDPAAVLHLNYIDDIVAEFLRALAGHPTREDDFCVVRPEYCLTLDQLTKALYAFREGSEPPAGINHALTGHLRATYDSFLPA